MSKSPSEFRGINTFEISVVLAVAECIESHKEIEDCPNGRIEIQAPIHEALCSSLPYAIYKITGGE